MSARDPIDVATDVACAVGNAFGRPVFEGVHREVVELSLRRLTAAGYRILAPGKIDKETVERALHIVEADCPRHVGERFRADETPSKNDKCVHGLPMYEDCVECIGAALRSIGEKE